MPGIDKMPGFLDDVINRLAPQRRTKLRDDAIGAMRITPILNFQKRPLVVGLPLAQLETLLQREAPAAGVLMLPVEEAGTLTAVHGVDDAKAVPGIVDVEISIVPGRHVAPLPEGDRYLGFVLAKAPTAQEVERALRDAWSHLKVEVS